MNLGCTAIYGDLLRGFNNFFVKYLHQYFLPSLKVQKIGFSALWTPATCVVMWGRGQLAGGPEFAVSRGEEHEGGALLEVVASQGALRRALNLSRQVPLV